MIINKKIKFNIILLICTLIILFLFLEIFLRVFFPLEEDEYSNHGLLLSLGHVYQKSNDSLIDVELMPNMIIYEEGIEYKINSKGMRDYEFPYEKPQDTYRVVVLGDSVTFGYNIHMDDSYPKQLERLLNENNKEKYEVINLGVGAYNTWQEFQLLKNEGLKYNPDLIIFGFLFNDLIKDERFIFRNFTIDYSEEKSCKITYTNIKLPCKVISFLRNIRVLTFSKYRLNNILQYKKGLDYYQNLYYNEHSVKDFDEIFANISKLSEDKNIPILFVIFPLIVKDYNKYEYNSLHEDMRIELKKYNLKYIDLLDAYLNSKNKLYLAKLDMAHPNTEGHNITARVIYEYLIKEELIKR